MTLNIYKLEIKFRFLSPVLVSRLEQLLLLLEPTVSMSKQSLIAA
jgi:hypothetical protein